jgi:hypothetical protein
VKRSTLFLLLIFLTLEAHFLLLTFIPANNIRALATSPHTFFFKFASNITTLTPNIQNVTNTYGVLVNVKVYVQTILNQSYIKNFRLSVNNTNFILISNGVLTQTQNIYFNLHPSETLYYTASASPIATIHNGDVASIQYITEIYEAVPVPTLPPTPALPSYAFDIQITTLPHTVTCILFFGQNFEATLTTINKGLATDATITWQLLNIRGEVVSSSTFTTFFQTGENKTLKITIPTPPTGTYTLKAQVEKPAIAVATKTFNVITIPIYIIIVIAIIIIAVALAILKKKQKI